MLGSSNEDHALQKQEYVIGSTALLDGVVFVSGIWINIRYVLTARL